MYLHWDFCFIPAIDDPGGLSYGRDVVPPDWVSHT